ncbi:histidine kinase [Dinghuibacter silviterrae]|uniref:Histidine kinase n=2 Tax=Dinghuibacter silviterrae TaxID=1539049 RepID=A0A4R8DWX3_9BACT|nr:histidine kinase [Dinghuibacter silviterrae]
MAMEEKYKQLIRVGIVFIVFAFLMLLLNIYLGGPDEGPGDRHTPGFRLTTQPLVLTLCWAVNLAVLRWLQPVLSRRFPSRWLNFYLPGFVALYLTMVAIFGAWVHFDDHGGLLKLTSGTIAVETLALVIIELVLSRLDAARVRLENAELRVANLEAQHEKLIRQLQPHFLFNSLNALKSLIRRSPPDAEGYLIKLSEFLRFSLSHTQQSLVTLEEELRFSMYYLDMQQTRFQEGLHYIVDIPDGNRRSLLLPAFSLQLLLENAIKHNSLTLKSPLIICIRFDENGRLLVENNRQPKQQMEEGTGLGLVNLSERYRMLLKEDIRVTTNETFFQVSLGLMPADEDHHY